MDKDERKFTLIETEITETDDKVEPKTLRQTNPIAKKFVEFHNSKADKFKVKDLFNNR